MQQLPTETELKIRAVLARSSSRGTDPVRALLELGHLWYPARQREVQVGTLRQTADLLMQFSPRGWRTAADAQQHIALWLREQADQMEGK